MPGQGQEVQVRQINPTDNNAKIKTPENGNFSAVYADYVIQSKYDGDLHTYMLGVTAPEHLLQGQDTVAFVRLSTKTLLWIVDWTAARWQLKPKIPNPYLLNANYVNHWVFLDEKFQLGQIELGSDGVSPRYRISGTYFYGLKRPSAFTNKDMVFPRLPWIEDFATRDVPDGMFEQGLINKG